MRNYIVFSCLLFLKNGFCIEAFCRPNVAVIGGGIGGASASHFLAELFKGDVKIDLYEAGSIGGRLATTAMDDNEYESGGSVIHPENRYMRRFTNFLGLEPKPMTSSQRYGLWNGSEFVFEESHWQILNYFKLLLRYGLQPFQLQRQVNSVLSDFARIYDLQDAGWSFTNVSGLLRSMNTDFPNLMKVSIKELLLSMGYKERLIDELVKTTLVTNYNQDTSVQSFVGWVSIAGMSSGLWSVKGGNKEVPINLIRRNKCINVVSAYVEKIRYVGNHSMPLYELHYRNNDNSNTGAMKSLYDIVIVATPLTHDQDFPLTFENLPKTDFEFPGSYSVTYATFLKGDLNLQYFGLQDDIDGILSCNVNRTKVNSIGRLDPVYGSYESPNEKSRIWKIFSKHSLLSSSVIHEMFSKVEEVKEMRWKAYPKYSCDVRLDKFKLHDALYHVNAIEWAASAMEMSAIGGRNVAILAHDDYSLICPSEKDAVTSKTPIFRDSDEL